MNFSNYENEDISNSDEDENYFLQIIKNKNNSINNISNNESESESDSDSSTENYESSKKQIKSISLSSSSSNDDIIPTNKKNKKQQKRKDLKNSKESLSSKNNNNSNNNSDFNNEQQDLLIKKLQSLNISVRNSKLINNSNNNNNSINIIKNSKQKEQKNKNRVFINNNFNTSTTTTTTTTTLSSSTPNNNNNNSDGNNNDEPIKYVSELMFFKVWRNLVLRNNIYKFIKLYNIHKSSRYYFFNLGDNDELDGEIGDFGEDELDYKDFGSTSSDDYKNYYSKYHNAHNSSQNNNNQEVSSNSLIDTTASTNFDPFFDKNQKKKEKLKEIEIEREIQIIDKVLKLESVINSYRYKSFLKSVHIDILQKEESLKSLLETLPPHVDTLIIDNFFKKLYTMEENTIPESITHLEVGILNRSRVIFNENSIPVSIRTLKFPKFSPINFDTRILTRCTKLETLIFTFGFNRRIWPDSLPSSLKRLEVGLDFNDIIISLPEKLNTLVLGREHRRSIQKDLLPPTLEKLHLSDRFIYSSLEKGLLPKSIKDLKITFGDIKGIDHFIDSFPKLEKLKIGGYAGGEIDLRIPESCTSLSLVPSLSKESLFYLPSSIKSLTIGYRFYGILMNYKLSGDTNNILNRIEKLKFRGGSGILELTNLAAISNIKSLNFTRTERISFAPQDGDFSIFHHLETLKLQNSYNKPLILPPQLKYLQLGSSFNKTIVNLHQVPLECLKFGREYNLLVDQLPSTLKILELGEFQHQSINSRWLPSNLEILIINSFIPDIQLPLPSTLHSIYISSFNSSILLNNEKLNQFLNIIKPIDEIKLYTIYKKLVKQYQIKSKANK